MTASSRDLQTALPLVFLTIAILLPRVLALDRFITADEHKWLTRSANFYCALGQGLYGQTYQREHPGVTTMWAGTAALLWRFPAYRLECTSQASVGEFERNLAQNDYAFIDVLVSARIIMILAHTVVLLLSFAFARRVLGGIPALVGIGLVALDPFHVAHSRVMHLDGLLSSLVLLALLAFLDFLSKRRLPSLLVSGSAAGLSFLTKSPSVILVPAVGLIALIDLGRRWMVEPDRRLARPIWSMAGTLLLWAGISTAVFGALWPAMWIEPIGTLSRMFDAGLTYAVEGHGSSMFFDGQVLSEGSLGLSFFRFYPTTYVWRSTPVVLLGLLFAVVAYALGGRPLDETSTRQAVRSLILFALLFAGVMTLGDKKFDRYLLAVYPSLDLVAATGWAALAHWLVGRQGVLLRRYGVSALVGVVIVIQAAACFGTYPYYFSYYNPLLGGSRRAPSIMMVGWGEGLDEAARYLNQKPNASNLVVASWYRRPFAAFFDGTARRIPIRTNLSDAELEKLFDSDYVVIYIHQWQRQMPSKLLDCLAEQTPEWAIWINGLEYARVYSMGDMLENHPIRFEAEARDVAPGTCTWLRWAVDDVREVYVDGEGVAGHDQCLVCPQATTLYRLRVVHPDGSQTLRSVRVVVQD